MTRYSAPKLAGYASLSAVGLLAALALAQPELVALTAPFLLAVGAGLALAATPRLSARIELEHDRALEGEEVAARIVVESATPVDRLELYVDLPDGVDLVDGKNPVALRLAAGERRELELTLRARRWGAHMLGPLYTRTRDPLGFLVWEATAPTRPQLRTYPRENVLRRILQPRETQVFSGNEVSRRKGEGIEFADIRPRGARRSTEPDQLARERAAERAVGQREPSRAEHGRDHLRRLVRRSAARGREHARPRGARNVARSPMPTCAGEIASG